MDLINLVKLPKKRIKHYSPSGERTKPSWGWKFDEKLKCPNRYQVGVIDFDDYIQQSANDVDFKAIGEMLVDNRANVVSHFDFNGEVVDVTGHPRNVHELNDLYVKAQQAFDGFDDATKTLFNNDFNVFRSAYMAGNMDAMLAGKNEKQVEVKKQDEKQVEKQVEKKEGDE